MRDCYRMVLIGYSTGARCGIDQLVVPVSPTHATRSGFTVTAVLKPVQHQLSDQIPLLC